MAAIPTLTLPEILERADAHDCGDLPRLLVAGGTTKLRIGVFALTDEDELELLVDAYPDGAALPDVAQAVKPALLGRWDAQDTGRWGYAWTVGTADWQLWSRVEGRSFWLEEGEIHRSGPRPALPAEQVAAIQTWASPGWYEQGAEVRLEDETTVVLAHTTSWAARLDPAYDFDQLTKDLTWAEQLCRDLANLLHVPVGESIPERDL